MVWPTAILKADGGKMKPESSTDDVAAETTPSSAAPSTFDNPEPRAKAVTSAAECENGGPATPDDAPNDADSQIPNPDDAQPAGGVSDRKCTANRSNAQKSTGPQSEMGKRIASHNSFKNGYYSNERRLQLMAQLQEDPKERERLRQDVYSTYPPGSTVERLLVRRSRRPLVEACSA
jgi:hypothetical protein